MKGLNDENHTQIVSPGKKKPVWPDVLINVNECENGGDFCSTSCLCILKGKKLEATLPLKNLEYISLTFLTMTKTINTEYFI